MEFIRISKIIKKIKCLSVAKNSELLLQELNSKEIQI
jgi:hypothetical protein